MRDRSELAKAKILIAEPFMQDPHFKKAVVLITDYSIDEGTVGFILNKITPLNIRELISSFPECDSQVCYGGPVANDTIHYIHRAGDLIENSREIMPGLFWGGDFNKIKFLIANKVLSDRDIKFYVGYSGWSSGQVEEELETGSWIIDDMDMNYVFGANRESLWHLSLKNKGDNFRVLADMSDSFSQN